MSGSIKSWLISGSSMLAGMACVAAIWSAIPKEDETTIQNKARFSELSGLEQADLRNKAKAFVDAINESDLARLQQIHSAVESDPKLLTRLQSLGGLLANLDADAEAKLNPDGEFANDWAQQVQILAQDKNAGDVTYEFEFDVLAPYGARGPRIVVCGHKYEAFLDKASGGDWGANSVYQTFIDGNDRTTRRMFKTLALADRSMEDDSDELNSSILALAREMLMPKGSYKEERGRPPEPPSYESGDKERDEAREREREKSQKQKKTFWTNVQTVKILESGLHNIKKDFLCRCLARKTVAPEVFTEHFKRSEQIKLMAMAPADANQELIARLVKENNVQGPESARVNEILAEAKSRRSDRVNQLREIGRKIYGDYRRGRDGRGGDRRGGDGRGGDGRGDRSEGDRGPGGRGGGRGPGGARFGEDGGPDGPPRRGPDNRPEDDRERDSKRPSQDRDLSESGKNKGS